MAPSPNLIWVTIRQGHGRIEGKFLCSTMRPFLRPDLQANGVRWAERRSRLAAGHRPQAARSGLDRREHSARLEPVGTMIGWCDLRGSSVGPAGDVCRVASFAAVPRLACAIDRPCRRLTSYSVGPRSVTRMPHAARQQAMSEWDPSLTTIGETQVRPDRHPTRRAAGSACCGPPVCQLRPSGEPPPARCRR